MGFLSIDVDLYSSTKSVLGVLRGEDASCYLPAFPVWVDDSFISLTATRFAGEALAIEEFNRDSDLRKIDFKLIRTNSLPAMWHHCFAFAHIFDHPVRRGEASYDLSMLFDVDY